jgi:hypothetical protein
LMVLDNLRIGEPNACWPWAGKCRTWNGYAQTHQGLAHRVVYETLHGPIPPGMQIDHLCRNRECTNPNHLEVVTPRENQLRGNGVGGRNARKTHCPKGHPYDGTHSATRGGRRCKRCHADQERERHRRKHACL